jgi:hypothetical protein
MVAGSEPKLEAAAIRDLKELQEGLNQTADESGPRVLASIQRNWPGNQIFEMNKDAEPNPVRPTKPSGKKLNDNFRQFLETVTTWQTPQADTAYALVLWGHAYGLGFGRTHGEALTLSELRTHLDAFKTSRGGKKLDLLIVNACAMSYVEAAYELADVVERLVSSQISVPFAGLPYDTIAQSLHNGLNSAEFGRAIVDAYVDSYAAAPGRERVSMTVLHLDDSIADKSGARDRLKKAVTTFAVSLSNVLQPRDPPRVSDGADLSSLARVRETFFSVATGDVQPLLDVTTLANALTGLDEELKANKRPTTGFSDALQKLSNLVAKAPQGIVEYHRRHPDLDDVNGLGIYAPFVSSDNFLRRLGLLSGDATAGTGESDYRDLELFKEAAKKPNENETADTIEGPLGKGKNAWPSLVYGLLRQSVPDYVFDCVDGSGATDSQSRSEIAQLAVQLHSMFNQFDAVIRSRQAKIVEVVGTLARTPGCPETRAEHLAKLRLLDADAILAVADGVKWRYHPTGSSAGGVSPPAAMTASTELNKSDVIDLESSFSAIETALERLEKTVRRVLTNSRFGLGPPPGTSPAYLGIGNIKQGGELGLDNIKQGGELGKPGGEMGKGGGEMGKGGGEMGKGGGEMGPMWGGLAAAIKTSLSAILATASSDDHTALGIVASLFGHVSTSLRGIEEALASAESIAVRAACCEATKEARAGAAFAANTRLSRAFRILEEASLTARRTVVRVMAHPSYGLGPGPEDLTADDRRELAVAGGFSSERLRLL